jgi:hypothetical protein
MEVSGQSSVGWGGAAPIKESVTPEEKARYDQLLKEVQDILSKTAPPTPPFTTADSKRLERLLTELKGMHDQGLTGSMDQFLDVVFAFAEAAGADPSQNDFYLSPTEIEAMSKAHITIAVPKNDGSGTYVNQSMTLAEAIGITLDPTYDPAATQKLGDMLLEFSNWGYDMYTQQLKDLQQQIEIATTAINNLNELLAILNMTKGQSIPGFNYHPTKWDEIPPAMQGQVRSAMGYPANPPPPFGPYWNSDGTPTDKGMAAISQWTYDNPDAYANIADTYFRTELGIEPDLQPDAQNAAARLLSARDQLYIQKMLLEKSGADTGPGSPYATIDAVLKDIDKQFPPTGAPPTYPYPNPDLDAKPPVLNLTDWYDFPNNSLGSTDPTDKMNAYIREGNATNSALAKSIDDAIQANQNLSSKMSDEIKAKNLTLQTFFDILTQVSDALNKILTGTAQKVNR